jgi:hypothetical protein
VCVDKLDILASKLTLVKQAVDALDDVFSFVIVFVVHGRRFVGDAEESCWVLLVLGEPSRLLNEAHDP